MIAKIGMNNCGLGVCLNFMNIENYQPYGVPLHVILRRILDSKSLEEALSVINPHLAGKVGNIMIADSNGEIEDIELAGDEFFSIPVEDGFVHTWVGLNARRDFFKLLTHSNYKISGWTHHKVIIITLMFSKPGFVIILLELDEKIHSLFGESVEV